MSFPSKKDRQMCWDNRDLYWKCLDEKKSQDLCQEFRQQYEKCCPSQWVKHFDQKRKYLIFKDQLEKEGIFNDIGNNNLPIVGNNHPSCSNVKNRRRFFHTFPSSKPSTMD